MSNTPDNGSQKDQVALLFLYAEAPVHAGTGQGLGAVDQPIQREVHTSFPVIYGSGLKGALRSHVKKQDPDLALQLFGSAPPGEEATNPETGSSEKQETDDNTSYPGALSPHDAQILLFPVQSMFGGFAWITCATALAQLLRNLALLGYQFANGEKETQEGTSPSDTYDWILPTDIKPGKCIVTSASNLKGNEAQVWLREFSFQCQNGEDNVGKIATWLKTNAMPERLEYWSNRLSANLAILSDEDFQFFVQTATEIYTRVRLNENKTVATGALWVEEALPPESLLCAPVPAKSVQAPQPITAHDALEKVAEKCPSLVIGGTETIGRGRMALKWLWSPKAGGEEYERC